MDNSLLFQRIQLRHNLCDPHLTALDPGGQKMKWLEIITLRTAGQSFENLVDKLMGPLTETARENGPLAIQIYCHASLDTDLSIHIHWDTRKISRQKTLLGSCLASRLEDFGMIHHTIWIAQN